MRLSGRAQCFGDDINTDYIIAAQYKAVSLDMREMARHTFEDIDPDFVTRIRAGDIVVAGKNFGCGSSRETAVHVLTECGVAAVIAPSFARIFFRNAINNGLPVLECDVDGIKQADPIEVDLEAGIVAVPVRQITRRVTPLPPVMRELLRAGGIGAYLKLHGDLVLPANPERRDDTA